MTDKPTCGNCPHRKVFADDGSVGCKMSDTYLPLQAEALIEYVGCLSHPDAKQYLMRDVIEELERLEDGLLTSVFERTAYRKAISLIRAG